MNARGDESDTERPQKKSSSRAKSKYTFRQECEWLIKELLQKGVVKWSEFNRKFELGDRRDKWGLVRDALFSFQHSTNLFVASEPDKVTGEETLRLLANSTERYSTPLFNPPDENQEDKKAKRQIGALVALHLRTLGHRKPCFLGSGSTVLYTGRQMREVSRILGSYEQEFSTVNIALCADWCEHEPRPVEEVSIAEGTLKTPSFRYGDMEEPWWFAPIVVIGADGIHYAQGTGASLIANRLRLQRFPIR